MLSPHVRVFSANPRLEHVCGYVNDPAQGPDDNTHDSSDIRPTDRQQCDEDNQAVDEPPQHCGFVLVDMPMFVLFCFRVDTRSSGVVLAVKTSVSQSNAPVVLEYRFCQPGCFFEFTPQSVNPVQFLPSGDSNAPVQLVQVVRQVNTSTGYDFVPVRQ